MQDINYHGLIKNIGQHHNDLCRRNKINTITKHFCYFIVHNKYNTNTSSNITKVVHQHMHMSLLMIPCI